jgi:uncharacterized protein (TIGR03067 family)
MKSSSSVLIILCLSLIAKAAPADAADQDQASLQGVWQLVSMESSGSPALPQDKIKELKLTINGSNMSYRGPDGKAEEATFKLDPFAKPKAIDMTPSADSGEGKTLLLGVYSIDGDVLKICCSEAGDDRPKDIKVGKDEVLIVLNREKR